MTSTPSTLALDQAIRPSMWLYFKIIRVLQEHHGCSMKCSICEAKLILR